MRRAPSHVRIHIRVIALALVFALFITLLPQTVSAAAYDGHPKIVIILVIDQFRGDYLERYRADFKPNGFRLFQERGAYFTDCYYDYANTKTAPGHATIGTGAYTNGHGIADNQWWDLARNTKRPISSVEDERYITIGDDDACTQGDCTGASPRNLRASTLGDELRLATHGQAKVFGVSLKDRAAILPAGAAANGAFWMDHTSGHFLTSSYYMTALPGWARDFNAGPAAQQAITTSGLTNVKDFYDEVGETPAANSYELEFAKALIQGEQLGKHETTDLITISLSANDIGGHHYGPDSPQQKLMVDGLDTDLDGFFTWLDKYVDGGLGNVWIALSADHGIAPTPAVAASYGLPSANLDMKAWITAINAAMNAKFSPGEKIEYVLPKQGLPYLSLDQRAFEHAGANEQEAETAVRDALAPALASLPSANPPLGTASGTTPARSAASPALAETYTRLQLARGEYPQSEFGTLLAHSYTTNGGWYVLAILDAFQMEGSDPTRTTHYSPYSYDRHVPLAFFGAPFVPGTYHGRVAPVDMAATFASLLGVNQPSAAIGKVLTEALRAPQTAVAPVVASSAAAPTSHRPRTPARTQPVKTEAAPAP
jgi:hypothetical protein